MYVYQRAPWYKHGVLWYKEMSFHNGTSMTQAEIDCQQNCFGILHYLICKLVDSGLIMQCLDSYSAVFIVTVLQQWKGINCKQSTRWQHLSWLKASAFFSLQNCFSCFKTQQLILGTGIAIWWLTEPHCHLRLVFETDNSNFFKLDRFMSLSIFYKETERCSLVRAEV